MTFKILIGKQTTEILPPCPKITDKVKTLANELKVFALNTDNCLGLAANQVGLKERICIINANNKDKVIAAINPIIEVYTGEKYRTIERCLSFPGQKILAIRSSVVIVRYTDAQDGEEYLRPFEGI